ncbi:sugar O-acetyltransferase [Runella sp. CRIBMP]|nr:sugar O-acetyltransferase [Runella sp. CRIBMP]
MNSEKNIFERMLEGGIIPPDDPQMPYMWEIVNRTLKLNSELNKSTDTEQIRERLSEIIAKQIDASTTIFVPFYTNFGQHIQLGKNVFINHGCTFLDLGGIIIEDDVLIGPQVCIVTENHPIDPAKRKSLDLKSVTIERNAWIGANATILPGVTVGENSIVAAGAVVAKDVPANTVVGGVPAKELRNI